MPLDPFISFAIFIVAGIALCVYVIIDGKSDERRQKAALAMPTSKERTDGSPHSS